MTEIEGREKRILALVFLCKGLYWRSAPARDFHHAGRETASGTCNYPAGRGHTPRDSGFNARTANKENFRQSVPIRTPQSSRNVALRL